MCGYCTPGDRNSYINIRYVAHPPLTLPPVDLEDGTDRIAVSCFDCCVTALHKPAPYFTRALLTYILTYLLTPWCRVLLEKLTGLQLVKKFPAFHGTRRFITALTGVHHLSLSWASPIQSIYPHPTSWRSILILSTHPGLGLPIGVLLSGFPRKTL